MTVLGIAVAAGAVFGVSAPASAAIPGWSTWPKVSWEACQYWHDQKIKQGYLVTSCSGYSNTGYSFQYHR